MKTTVILKDDLLKEAMKITGLKEKTAVIHYGLSEIIRSAARKRLIELGGKMKKAKAGPRKK